MIEVSVVYSPAAREVREVTVQLRADATVLDALNASGLALAMTCPNIEALSVGIWGRRADFTQLLKANDRVEIYRPLTVDPKVARRERFAKQGARTAGLFTKKRAGAKAGY